AISLLTSLLSFASCGVPRHWLSFPTRRSSDLFTALSGWRVCSASSTSWMSFPFVRARMLHCEAAGKSPVRCSLLDRKPVESPPRSEEHTSELQSRENLVCRLLLEKKNRSKPQY